MKKKSLIVCCALFALFLNPAPAHAQTIATVIGLTVKKVIKAIDLQVQRIQNETIKLQAIQKDIENTLSKLKLDEISDWVQKQKDLYQEYFDELWKVKSIIAYYKRINDVIEKQKELVEEYKHCISLLQQDKNFSADEVKNMSAIYSAIVEESIKNLDQIITIIESFTVQMSDADRLQIITDAANNIEEQISELRQFNRQNMLLSIQRAQDSQDIDIIKKLYGLPN